MSESIDEILNKLRARVDGAATDAAPAPRAAARGATPLSADQISSAVHVIAPAQVSYVAEIFANRMAAALNMRAMAPRIRQLAEQSLRQALGAARKQGTNV